MIDLKNVERNTEEVLQALGRKGVDATLLDELKTLFVTLKEKRTQLENLQATQNEKSKLMGVYAREKKDMTELKAELSENKAKVTQAQTLVRELDEKLESIAMNIPNLPDTDVPNGADEEENVEIKTVLEKPTFEFDVKEHWDLAEGNGWIDFQSGVKLAKSRFSVLRNDGARVARALISYMLDFNRERGFVEVNVPHIANRETLLATGQLPKFEDDLFKIEGEDLFLIPTAEVPVTNLFRDEIIPEDELPIMMTAYTPCFRKEAGSAGRDTRGIIRQHQFDKVELVSITKPDESDAMLDKMVSCASDLLSSLGLPHRHMLLCTGDLGFGAAKTIDLEVWLPGAGKYREISSISNTRDFQARRGMIRYKDGKKNRLVNTLNGSSLAVGRTLLAIMENYQNADGSIGIPDVLKKYL